MKCFSPVTWIVLILLFTFLAAGCAKSSRSLPLVGFSPPEKKTLMPPVETAAAEPQPVMAGTMKAELAKAEPVKIEPVMAAPAPEADLVRIHFAFDQSTLSAEARDILAANATALQANPDLKIRIEGHCDKRGSDEYNLALGERRAQAAKDYLMDLGVTPERLETISYGEESPLDGRNAQDAWAKNRRAEFQMVR